MSTQPLYCHRCNRTYNVRQEDLRLMQQYQNKFDHKGYLGGCFFKDLGRFKRLQKLREQN